MPKSGFKSITISQDIYNKSYETFLREREELAVNGVRSLSGYISYVLEARMREDEALAHHTPMIKRVGVEEGRIILLDTEKNRIADVVARNGEPYCRLCKTSSCMHVGFAYAMPEVSDLLDAPEIQ